MGTLKHFITFLFVWGHMEARKEMTYTDSLMVIPLDPECLTGIIYLKVTQSPNWVLGYG